ncbi:MAG: hypothetical protein KGJ13_02835 [Patescibacteria group bacterium]|nr:hypothetical protein [Patescibacteria group bacterium]
MKRALALGILAGAIIVGAFTFISIKVQTASAQALTYTCWNGSPSPGPEYCPAQPSNGGTSGSGSTGTGTQSQTGTNYPSGTTCVGTACAIVGNAGGRAAAPGTTPYCTSNTASDVLCGGYACVNGACTFVYGGNGDCSACSGTNSSSNNSGSSSGGTGTVAAANANSTSNCDPGSINTTAGTCTVTYNKGQSGQNTVTIRPCALNGGCTDNMNDLARGIGSPRTEAAAQQMAQTEGCTGVVRIDTGTNIRPDGTNYYYEAAGCPGQTASAIGGTVVWGDLSGAKSQTTGSTGNNQTQTSLGSLSSLAQTLQNIESSLSSSATMPPAVLSSIMNFLSIVAQLLQSIAAGAKPATTPATTATTTPPSGFSINGATTGNFSVGQNWTLNLTAHQYSNAPVEICAIHPNGVQDCSSALNGVNLPWTDASGNWKLTGTFGSSTVGQWTEWLRFPNLNNATSNPITFTVNAAPAPSVDISIQGGVALSSGGSGWGNSIVSQGILPSISLRFKFNNTTGGNFAYEVWCPQTGQPNDSLGPDWQDNGTYGSSPVVKVPTKCGYTQPGSYQLEVAVGTPDLKGTLAKKTFTVSIGSGACGSANGVTVTPNNPPTAGLCSLGTASTPTLSAGGTEPGYAWDCSGANGGGSSVACFAQIMPYITAAQGYDPSTGVYTSTESSTPAIALQNTYLIVWGSFANAGNTVYIDNAAVQSSYQSSNQINVPLSGLTVGNHTVKVSETPFTPGANAVPVMSNIMNFTIQTKIGQ